MADMGSVEIELGGLLVPYAQDQLQLTVDAGGTIREVAAALGISPNQSLVAVVNGRTCDLAYRLVKGDKLKLLPTIGGG
jgi:sulfur carrier protein ThiS